MSISKSIYELAVIANSLGKLLEGSSKIVQNEAYQWYKSSFVSKTIQDSCDNSQPMYEEMQNISTTIRNQVSPNINQKENPFQSQSQKRSYSTKSYSPGDEVELQTESTSSNTVPDIKPKLNKTF